MKPKITELRFEWERYWIYMVAVPTKKGKYQPKLKYVVKDGIMRQEEDNSSAEIPNQVKNEIYRRAAIIFNKF
ncbi:MAG: hypothetical protein ACPLKV_03075 [Minisyncoccia bacterium]